MGTYITDLDAALAESGEDIILRRYVVTPAPDEVDVIVRANVRRNRQPSSIQGAVVQDEFLVIISPTQIAAAAWPDGTVSSDPLRIRENSLPRREDALVIKGKLHRIESVDPISAGGELVRIEIFAKGGASK